MIEFIDAWSDCNAYFKGIIFNTNVLSCVEGVYHAKTCP